MKNIKKFRLIKNIDQLEFAKLVGVSRTTMSYYENGVVNPSENAIQKMCEIFGCSVIELYGVDNFIIKPQTTHDIVVMMKCLALLLNNGKIKEEINELINKLLNSEDEHVYLSKMLRRIRKEKNLTLKEFSKEIGISSVELNNIELANNKPSIKTIEKIAYVLNMDVDELYNMEL